MSKLANEITRDIVVACLNSNCNQGISVDYAKIVSEAYETIYSTVNKLVPNEPKSLGTPIVPPG